MFEVSRKQQVHVAQPVNLLRGIQQGNNVERNVYPRKLRRGLKRRKR